MAPASAVCSNQKHWCLQCLSLSVVEFDQKPSQAACASAPQIMLVACRGLVQVAGRDPKVTDYWQLQAGN